MTIARRDFVARGQYPVGIATSEVADPDDPGRVLPLDVWYPAAAKHAGEDEDAQRCASHPFGQPHRAVPDAAPDTGTFPLIAFSHGNSGVRRQSTFLTTHLASWGFIVVAPDHTGNTFPDMQGIDEEQRRTIHRAARSARPRDISTAIDHVLTLNGRIPMIDIERMGALGHSFGGWTSLKMPRRDARIRAVCGLAPAAEPFVGRKAFEQDELPLARQTPALLIAGIEDVLVELDASILSLHDRLETPRATVGIEGADHFHFCDGIALLHAAHQQTEREGLERPVLPHSDLLDEETTHDVLRSLVTHYFDAALRRRVDDPCLPFARGEVWPGSEVRSLG